MMMVVVEVLVVVVVVVMVVVVVVLEVMVVIVILIITQNIAPTNITEIKFLADMKLFASELCRTFFLLKKRFRL